MGWRDTLRPDEISDLQALDERLRDGYDENLWHERHVIIMRGHRRQTRLNRAARHG